MNFIDDEEEWSEVLWADVVGESFYRENLVSIVKALGETSRFADGVPAVLRLEDDNPHDSNAVSVWIAKLQVGHLSREDAMLFRESVEHLMDDDRSASVGAKIRGGKVNPDGSVEGHIGVVLKLRLPITDDRLHNF